MTGVPWLSKTKVIVHKMIVVLIFEKVSFFTLISKVSERFDPSILFCLFVSIKKNKNKDQITNIYFKTPLSPV